MDTIIENWELIVAIIVLILAIGASVVAFFILPTKKKKELITKWLLTVVLEAESKLGDGAGRAKLAYAYDQFIGKYKLLSTFISYEQFEAMVDNALEEMNKALSDSEELSHKVENGEL